jgi:hypothetical protein
MDTQLGKGNREILSPPVDRKVEKLADVQDSGRPLPMIIVPEERLAQKNERNHHAFVERSHESIKALRKYSKAHLRYEIAYPRRQPNMTIPAQLIHSVIL